METITKKEIKELILERFSVLLEKRAELKDMKRISTDASGRGGFKLLPRSTEISANGKKDGKNKDSRAGQGEQPVEVPVTTPAPTNGPPSSSAPEKPSKRPVKKTQPAPPATIGGEEAAAGEVPVETTPPKVKNLVKQEISVEAIGSDVAPVNAVIITSSTAFGDDIRIKYDPRTAAAAIGEIFKEEIKQYLLASSNVEDNNPEHKAKYDIMFKIAQSWQAYLSSGVIDEKYILNPVETNRDDGVQYLTYLMFKGVILNTRSDFQPAYTSAESPSGGPNALGRPAALWHTHIERMFKLWIPAQAGKNRVDISADSAKTRMHQWALTGMPEAGRGADKVLAAKGVSLRRAAAVATGSSRRAADAENGK